MAPSPLIPDSDHPGAGTTGFRRYRRRPVEVEAARWDPARWAEFPMVLKREVWELNNVPTGEKAKVRDEFFVKDNEGHLIPLWPGDWIVKEPGRPGFEVNNAGFADAHEPADGDAPAGMGSPRTDRERKLVARQALADRISAMGGHPRAGDLYDHFRAPYDGDPLDLYEVLMVGVDEAHPHVPRLGYRSRRTGLELFRPLDEWLETVEGGDGRLRPRYTLAPKAAKGAK